MKVIRGIRAFNDNIAGSVVTIGVFDGLHIGHRVIINRVVTEAKKSGRASVVITFYPHPRKALKPGHSIPSLISLRHRIKLIGELGVDRLLVIKFTESFLGFV